MPRPMHLGVAEVELEFTEGILPLERANGIESHWPLVRPLMLGTDMPNSLPKFIGEGRRRYGPFFHAVTELASIYEFVLVYGENLHPAVADVFSYLLHRTRRIKLVLVRLRRGLRIILHLTPLLLVNLLDTHQALGSPALVVVAYVVVVVPGVFEIGDGSRRTPLYASGEGTLEGPRRISVLEMRGHTGEGGGAGAADPLLLVAFFAVGERVKGAFAAEHGLDILRRNGAAADADIDVLGEHRIHRPDSTLLR